MSVEARLRVLVLENDADCRDIFVELLTFLGHEVEAAGTSAEGLRKAVGFEPDVVLVDLQVPDGRGCYVARTLGGGPCPPLLVATSGYGRESERSKAWGAGFDVFLLKPFGPDALEDVLQDERTLRRRLGASSSAR